MFGQIISTLKRFFYSPKRPDSGSGTHLTTLFNIYWFPFLGGKAPEREVDSPHSKAQVSNVWSYRPTCTPTNAFLGSTGKPYFWLRSNVWVYSEDLGSHCELPLESLINADDCPHYPTSYSFALSFIFISVLGLRQISSLGQLSRDGC